MWINMWRKSVKKYQILSQSYVFFQALNAPKHSAGRAYFTTNPDHLVCCGGETLSHTLSPSTLQCPKPDPRCELEPLSQLSNPRKHSAWCQQHRLTVLAISKMYVVANFVIKLANDHSITSLHSKSTHKWHYRVWSNVLLTRVLVSRSNFYRAMLAERGYEIVLSSVCPSVCLSVTLRYDFHIDWNTSKIISRPNSLRSMCSLTPNIGDLV